MANEPFTLIVVPGPEGEIRRFRGHPRQLKRAIAFCVVLMLGAAAAVVHLWSLSDAVGENELLRKRNQVALNTDFSNYRDFRFAELGRFDYTKEDCYQFHEAVKLHVMPLVNQLYEDKKKKFPHPVSAPCSMFKVFSQNSKAIK